MSLLAILLLSTAAQAAPPKASESKGIDQQAVSTCYYGGQQYSQWALLPNGQICQPDGSWSYPQNNPDLDAASSSRQP